MPTSVMWFRRDLRLADNPALCTAIDHGDRVVPLFVFDPRLWDPAGPARRAYLLSSLADLGGRIGGMQYRSGTPAAEVLAVARAAGAESVHVAADFGPYGSVRDGEVERALAEHGIALERTGSPYAVAPGRIVKQDGTAYQVFTPFSRAWAEHGWRDPVPAPSDVEWTTVTRSADPPPAQVPDDVHLPAAGEAAALGRWLAYLDRQLADYHAVRDRPDLDRTSHMSVHLKWGEIHPRTMLADIAASGTGRGQKTYRSELAWREFYADVLWRQPGSARDHLRPAYARMAYDRPGKDFLAWTQGRTGFPIVDAGMRQLAAQGWMHNRLRMIVASFLVKDLHIEWQHGARHFMTHLVDGDLASNQHGWQWVAGSGTDAAPYFRVFNPITQGAKFDPDGGYVRRYVEELRDVEGKQVHEPWDLPGDLPGGYPQRIVDHAQERREALQRHSQI